jgi:antirestriction protein ArdC
MENGKQQLIDQLTAGIEALTSSEEWERYLAVQARFHNYSFGNVLLIHLQRPTATRVAGYRAWQALGRQVQKGEKAIKIWAPMIGKDKEADDGSTKLYGFRLANVFDVAQTDGEELPEIVHLLTGDGPEGVWDRLVDIAQELGFAVGMDELNGPNGWCNHMTHEIMVEVNRDDAQQMKTLVHEIGHAILHGENRLARELMELEAESVAYIVCQAVGLETSDYSFGYVAHWAGESAVEGIRASGERIQKAANQVLGMLERTPVAA